MQSFSSWPFKAVSTQEGVGVLFQQKLKWGWVAEVTGDESGPPELPTSFQCQDSMRLLILVLIKGV